MSLWSRCLLGYEDNEAQTGLGWFSGPYFRKITLRNIFCLSKWPQSKYTPIFVPKIFTKIKIVLCQFRVPLGYTFLRYFFMSCQPGALHTLSAATRASTGQDLSTIKTPIISFTPRPQGCRPHSYVCCCSYSYSHTTINLKSSSLEWIGSSYVSMLHPRPHHLFPSGEMRLNACLMNVNFF